MCKIDYYLKMRNVQRFSGTFIHRPNNLLEHSFMVGMLFKYFADLEKMPITMEMFDTVLHHDIAEAITGDLIYTVKNYNKVTKMAWETIENEIMRKHSTISEYSDDKIKEKLPDNYHKLFKCCDLLDIWILLMNEVSYGNKNPQITEIIKRCEDIISETGDFFYIAVFMDDYREKMGVKSWDCEEECDDR